MDTWSERIARDELWEQAWEVLADTFKYPPSLEGFDFTLETARERSGQSVTAVQHARVLAEGCPKRARL